MDRFRFLRQPQQLAGHGACHGLGQRIFRMELPIYEPAKLVQTRLPELCKLALFQFPAFVA